jgi:hypothetical protein
MRHARRRDHPDHRTDHRQPARPCPRLKVIANYAVGYDNIDISAAAAIGNTPPLSHAAQPGLAAQAIRPGDLDHQGPEATGGSGDRGHACSASARHPARPLSPAKARHPHSRAAALRGTRRACRSERRAASARAACQESHRVLSQVLERPATHRRLTSPAPRLPGGAGAANSRRAVSTPHRPATAPMPGMNRLPASRTGRPPGSSSSTWRSGQAKDQGSRQLTGPRP